MSKIANQQFSNEILDDGLGARLVKDLYGIDIKVQNNPILGVVKVKSIVSNLVKNARDKKQQTYITEATSVQNSDRS